MVACLAVMVMAVQSYNVNHFLDAYDTSNNHTIRAPHELVVDSGGTTSQGISNGAMCRTVAIPAVWLVFITGLIQTAYAIGLR